MYERGFCFFSTNGLSRKTVNNGHFFSTIQAYGLPYDNILAADPESDGQALLREFGQ